MWSNADFGQALIFIAEKIKLNQKQLASALKVKPKTVSTWKRGARRPNPSARQALPSVLKCTMAQIEEVAAYHAMWRQILNGGAISTASSDADSSPPENKGKGAWPGGEILEYRALPDREREIGRIVLHLARLLNPEKPEDR
jgi:transcriptional regulator with XRE-family HTH domain